MREDEMRKKGITLAGFIPFLFADFSHTGEPVK
jgi:hypothetical protein